MYETFEKTKAVAWQKKEAEQINKLERRKYGKLLGIL
jgi:hypothetical protein